MSINTRSITFKNLVGSGGGKGARDMGVGEIGHKMGMPARRSERKAARQPLSLCLSSRAAFYQAEPG